MIFSRRHVLAAAAATLFAGVVKATGMKDE
jgi:hypothetical protein